ncbi:ABC transporter substrate-binding protein [Lederbergia citrea]|uniref:ABC transporter substrate-binding protein n=1 Tax=Lederbergia citrea TaxID=2833581 RepID=A0A942UTP6_9BACI|nr:ABC transporter substrate-binding protein [Lederbergia citrea]MBS4179521.1 ABC transporter substrate-binding protein [Lederbergia citrea]MBS4206189.1 ABC transporter substrate-binding protein [Lederbergia citrea]MBS4224876.1 ABC transporter substrate-binding protein [Lederbergia citrea]
MKPVKILAVMFLSFIVVLAGCSKSSGSNAKGEITLQYWNIFTGPDGENMKKMVDEFNKDHKGEIQIKSETMPAGNFYDKVRTVVSQGKAPDVAIMHLDQIAKYSAMDVLEPLDELADNLNMSESDFIQQVWNAGVYDGKRYGVPLDVHPLALYYNKDLLEKSGFDAPPKTLEELISMSKKIQEDNSGVWGTAIPPLWPSGFIFHSALYQFGGESVSPDGLTPLYNSEAGVNALQTMADLVHKEGVSPKNIQQDGEVTLFRQGKLAFHFNGIWMINGFNEQDGLNYGAAPIPVFGEKEATFAGSHNFVIPKQKKQDPAKLEAAMTFIKYITDNSLEWAKAGQIPAKNSVRDSDEFKALEHQSAIAEQVPYLVFPPASPTFMDAWSPTDEAINLAVLGKKSAKEALDAAADKGKKQAEAAAKK